MKTAAWRIRRGIESVMALFLLGMVALTFADVIGRRLFATPIYGANDITEHLMALTVFAGLPLVTIASAHLTVDLFDGLVTHPRMAWWRALIALTVAAILGLIAWLFLQNALNAARITEVSQALRIPRAPLYGVIAASCAVSAIAALIAGFAGPMVDPEDTHEETAT